MRAIGEQLEVAQHMRQFAPIRQCAKLAHHQACRHNQRHRLARIGGKDLSADALGERLGAHQRRIVPVSIAIGPDHIEVDLTVAVAGVCHPGKLDRGNWFAGGSRVDLKHHRVPTLCQQGLAGRAVGRLREIGQRHARGGARGHHVIGMAYLKRQARQHIADDIRLAVAEMTGAKWRRQQ